MTSLLIQYEKAVKQTIIFENVGVSSNILNSPDKEAEHNKSLNILVQFRDNAS